MLIPISNKICHYKFTVMLCAVMFLYFAVFTVISNCTQPSGCGPICISQKTANMSLHVSKAQLFFPATFRCSGSFFFGQGTFDSLARSGFGFCAFLPVPAAQCCCPLRNGSTQLPHVKLYQDSPDHWIMQKCVVWNSFNTHQLEVQQGVTGNTSSHSPVHHEGPSPQQWISWGLRRLRCDSMGPLARCQGAKRRPPPMNIPACTVGTPNTWCTAFAVYGCIWWVSFDWKSSRYDDHAGSFSGHFDDPVDSCTCAKIRSAPREGNLSMWSPVRGGSEDQDSREMAAMRTNKLS